jgi:tRNA threonylcarbamoyladenosine biosynthesis protein TsaE
MRIEIPSIDKIQEAARLFVSQMGDAKVFALYGQMGAGKTTFVKAVCRELGVEDVVTSPTFALVNEYTAGDGSPVFHFDFYRVKSLEEVYDMGFEDYLYGGALCLVEWPELVEELLPRDAVAVTIRTNADGSRSIAVER